MRRRRGQMMSGVELLRGAHLIGQREIEGLRTRHTLQTRLTLLMLLLAVWLSDLDAEPQLVLAKLVWQEGTRIGLSAHASHALQAAHFALCSTQARKQSEDET